MSVAHAPILVTGASGTVGSVVARLLREAGAHVRTAVRSPGPEDRDAKAFDFTSATTWDAAFAGVRQLFLVRPPQLARPRRDLIPALQRAQELGVEHVVFLSVQGADRNPLLPHAGTERWLRRSGMSWTFLRAAYFMQNLLTVHRADLAERDAIVVPAGAGKTSFVDAEDVAAVAVAALLDPRRHANRAWTPTGPEALSYDQVADILTATLGRPIRYLRPGALGYARHARGRLDLPRGMTAVTLGLYTAARLGLAAGLTDDVATVVGRPPTSFAAFAAREAAAWRRPSAG